MDLAPVLKFVSIKVDDLQYAVNYFADLFELNSNFPLDITSEENSNRNETFDTEELFSEEGGASLQFVQIDSNKIVNPAPNLLQLGIIGVKIKTHKLSKSFFKYRDKNIQSISDIRVNPLYYKHFHFVTQDFLFQIKEDDSDFFGFFGKNNAGVKGLIIGVSDIEKSKEFYQKVLGYNHIIFEGVSEFEDFEGIIGGDSIFKRVILRQATPADNKFKNFFGNNEIELLQVVEKENTFENAPNIVNPYRFGYFSVDNRDVIGNYTELGYKYESSGNDKFIQISDPDGVVITCQESTIHKKPTLFDDISILSKIFNHKL